MPAARPLEERDLPEAQGILRRAFGTFLAAPDLDSFWTDFDYVCGRFGADHVRAFGVDADGRLAGTNFATRWGSVGFFGPLSIRPDLWDRGFAQPLVAAVSDAFEDWGVRHAGLCTFPHSTKHVWLYQKFGFFPRFLIALMAAPASSGGAVPAGAWSRYSALATGDRDAVLAECGRLTDALYPGLDLGAEIRTVAARSLGDTVLLWQGESRLAGFAICHWGPASEAGEGCCFIKFGAAASGPGSGKRFASLLDASAALGRSVAMPHLLAGVSMAREEAYRHMVARGFRSRQHLLAMHRPNEPAYSRAGAFVLDDWR